MGLPTNLPAEARHKLAEYQYARDIETKIRVLEEALGLIPDHKGTEKLRRQLRKRLAELRRELEERKSKRLGGQDQFSVPKEAWAQIALIGPANSGKSSLFNAITGASSPVADYQLTTSRPYVGMMIYEGVEVQLVDLPPILTVDLIETNVASRCIGIARNSDLIAVVIDASRDVQSQLMAVLDLLEDYGISLKVRACEIEIVRTDSGGIRLVVEGELSCTYDEVKRLLNDVGIRSAIVKVRGYASIDDIEDHLIKQLTYKRGVVILGKADVCGADELRRSIEVVEEMGLKALATSAHDRSNVEVVKEVLFSQLGMMRVYTRKDGIISPKPILVRQGATVRELAELIHRELAENMRYAKVWGRSVRVQGERVGPEHVLMDRDVVEIRT